MKTCTIEIDVTIGNTEFGHMADNRFDYETGNDFNEFILECVEQLKYQICSLFEEEEDFKRIEQEVQDADFEVNYFVSDWGEVADFERFKDIELLNEIAEEVDDSIDWEVIDAAINCDVDLSDIEEAYQGEYKDDEDFAYETAVSCGDYNPKENHWPLNCIDWQYAAKELMYDYSASNGHYFRNL